MPAAHGSSCLTDVPGVHCSRRVQTTKGLIQGVFLWESLGFHDPKGISQPMELFAVLLESGGQTRLDIAAASHLTPHAQTQLAPPNRS